MSYRMRGEFRARVQCAVSESPRRHFQEQVHDPPPQLDNVPSFIVRLFQTEGPMSGIIPTGIIDKLIHYVHNSHSDIEA